MGGSTRSRRRFSGKRSLSPLPRLRGRVGEGALSTGPCRGVGPLPDPSPQAGEEIERHATRIQDATAAGAFAIAALVAAGISCAKSDAALRPYVIVGDAIPASLTGAPGDPVRGKAIVASRQTGLCLLCHSAPLPEEKFQGTIGPDLKGTGSRNTEGQLRLRIVDSRIFNPDTIMPAYYRQDGLERVAPAFRGKTVLTAEQIEDVVAFLMTLRD
jgi:sulfur-oxidizing protein SoxX